MNKYLTHSLTFLVGLAIGGTVGYFVTKKRLAAVMEETITQEVEDFKATYSDIRDRQDKKGDYETPGLSFAKLNDLSDEDLSEANAFINNMMETRHIIQAQKYETGSILLNGQPLDDHPDFEDGNVFDRPEPEVDETQRVDVEDLSFYQNRDHNRPFVISHIEFSEEEEDFDKITLKWYEGDDTLADENERTIDDVDAVISYDALQRFGDHSNDKDIVYVRNVNYGTDYEIIRDPRGYFDQVMPEEEKIEKIKKMRNDE